MDEDRKELIQSMGRLYVYLESIPASASMLDNVYELIKANLTYDPANRTLEWQPVNNRHEEGLLGERNALIYVAHVLTTEPAWVGIEILTSKQDQCDRALDFVVDGRTDHPETVQCKTGHVGKSGDLYVHEDWLEGSPDDVVAVCVERGIIYGGPLNMWKEVHRHGSSAINDESKWMYISYFKECGGWIVDIHEDVKKII